MKALSIRQPWAWLIVRPDITDPIMRATAHVLKDFENRDWGNFAAGRAFRGPVLVHASSGMTRDEYAACELFIAGFSDILLPPARALLRGGIVGRAVIDDCVTQAPSPWFTGEYGLHLRDAEPLPFRAFKGALGFFEVPAEQPAVPDRCRDCPHLQLPDSQRPCIGCKRGGLLRSEAIALAAPGNAPAHGGDGRSLP